MGRLTQGRNALSRLASIDGRLASLDAVGFSSTRETARGHGLRVIDPSYVCWHVLIDDWHLLTEQMASFDN